jgi:hypothetical protein
MLRREVGNTDRPKNVVVVVLVPPMMPLLTGPRATVVKAATVELAARKRPRVVRVDERGFMLLLRDVFAYIL